MFAIVAIYFTLFVTVTFLLKIYLKYRRINRWLDCNLQRKNPSFMFGDLYFLLHLYFNGDFNISQSNLNGFTVLANMYRSNKIIRMFSGYFTPWIVIFDYNYAKTYLSEQCTDRTIFTWFLEDYLGKGLLTLSGPKWTTRRKFLSHTFYARLFNEFIPTIDDYSRHLMQKLNEIVENKNGQLNDLDKFMSELSINVLLDTIMGIDAKSERLLCKRYAEATELCVLSLYERVYKPWQWLNAVYFRTEKGRKVKQEIDFVHNFAMSVIEAREARLNADLAGKRTTTQNNNDQSNNQRKRKPFLDNLLELHFANPESFTKVNIRDEVNTFLTAGHHTTSIALTFTVYLLGLHDEIQNKVFAEVHEAFDGACLRLSSIYNLKYLDAVIKESLRLYPPVPLVGRVTSHDTTVGPYVIPKGVSCAIPIMAIQRDPNLYEDPDSFNPSRFLNEDRLPLLAFSGGPRVCIGQKVAIIELKIVLAYIINNFIVKSLDTSDKLILGSSVTLNSTPIRIKLSKRL